MSQTANLLSAEGVLYFVVDPSFLLFPFFCVLSLLFFTRSRCFYCDVMPGCLLKPLSLGSVVGDPRHFFFLVDSLFWEGAVAK